MPKTSSIDWGLIQSLYMAGLTPKTIEGKTGVKADTVSVKAHRGKWREAMTKAVTITKGDSELQGEMQSSLAKSANKVRNALAQRLEALVDTLPTKSLSLRQELALQERLEPAVRNAKTVLAWSDGESPAIRIALLAAVQPQALPLPQAQVIECETVKASFSQGQEGKNEGWVDTEDGRARYAWESVRRIRRWLRLYKYRPVILDYDSLSALESAFPESWVQS